MLRMAVEEVRQRRGAWQRSLGLSGKQSVCSGATLSC